ncbi:DUF7521 family protein [Halohasta litorea]|uniref:Uncharacterized protein n=1 Tax=Halohasta litorea TaxID=869891 RepID=A0ABD6D644_9EURY|nr:hypothetical protein [Halohasta litorea]
MTAPELSVEGGSVVAVAVGFLLALGTIALSSWIVLVAYRGYRKSSERSILFLAVGIGLTATVPTVARIVVPTVGASALLSTAVAVAVQFSGLIWILYAVYGRPEDGGYRAVATAAVGSLFVLLAPLAAVERGIGESAAMTGVSAVTAVVGGFVAIQAYRGYRRYDRRPMLLLAVGVGLLTVGSFGTLTAVDLLGSTSDAVALGSVWSIELLGLLSILRSLTTDRSG